MSTYHTETAAEIHAIMTETGCKNDECRKTSTDDGWWECEGDVYCRACAVKLAEMPDTTVGRVGEPAHWGQDPWCLANVGLD